MIDVIMFVLCCIIIPPATLIQVGLWWVLFNQDKVNAMVKEAEIRRKESSLSA